jgi:hypothetical protein
VIVTELLPGHRLDCFRLDPIRDAIDFSAVYRFDLAPGYRSLDQTFDAIRC